jgi:hypothetical protein
MNDQQRFKLIDGTFSATDAAHILLSLVKSKMDFHNLEKLSNEERFGRDLAHSERRLAELGELYSTLSEICRDARASDRKLQVSGWLEISPVPSERIPTVHAFVTE